MTFTVFLWVPSVSSSFRLTGFLKSDTSVYLLNRRVKGVDILPLAVIIDVTSPDTVNLSHDGRLVKRVTDRIAFVLISDVLPMIIDFPFTDRLSPPSWSTLIFPLSLIHFPCFPIGWGKYSLRVLSPYIQPTKRLLNTYMFRGNDLGIRTT